MRRASLLLRAPRLLRLVCVFALSLAAQLSHAERLFIGILEADSYQSVIYGASAFSRVADLPIALEMINAELSKNLLLPSFACVASGDLLRIVQTVDPALPRSEDNPANVALIPLSGGAAGVHDLFAAAYTARRESGQYTIYEKPSDTNLAPRVALAVSGRFLLTSTSKEALAWAWENRSRLIDAPSQSIPGTLRMLVNPQRFADLLGSRSEKASSVFNFDKLLRDFETCLFSIGLDGQAFCLTLRGKPKAGTPLASLASSLRMPQGRLWNGLPDNAFFSMLTACDNPERWDTYLGDTRFRLLRPIADLAPKEAFSGDHLIYLSSTKDQQGLCLVQIEPVTNTAAVSGAIQKFATVKKNDGVFLTREPARSAGQVPIEAYSVALRPPEAAGSAKPEEPSTLFTLMSLFIKQAFIETAVKDGHLITVLGPAHSIENVLENLTFPDKALTLNRKIAGQDTALSEALCLGSTLHIVGLLRHIVTIMPGVKPEHLRLLPAGGAGATFGICQSADHTLTASLRFQASEIAALQRINRDGREVLQELFFQMFASQMLNLQAPKAVNKPAPR